MTHVARLAARRILRARAYAATFVVTASLALGATLAVFTVARSLVFRHLPYERPGDLVVALKRVPDRPNPIGVSPPEFADWKDENTVFTGIAAVEQGAASGGLLVGEESVRVFGSRVTPELFAVLGVPAALGRTFAASDSAAGAERVAVISYGLWARYFARDSAVLSRTLTFENQPYRIIGVLPDKVVLTYPTPTDLWLPVQERAFKRDSAARRLMSYRVYARLRPGISRTDAEASLNSLVRALNDRYRASLQEARAVLASAEEDAFGDYRGTFAMLWAGALMLYVVCCANVGALLLVRRSANARAMATQCALGCSTRRLYAEMLAEVAILWSIAGLLGFLVEWWLTAVLRRYLPLNLPRTGDVSLDLHCVAVGVGLIAVGVAVTSAFGLQRQHPIFPRPAADYAGGPKATRLRNAAVFVQIALTTALAVGSATFAVSYWKLSRVPLGFDPKGVVAASFHVPRRYWTGGEAAWLSLESQIVGRIRGLPGVRYAGVTTHLPMNTESEVTIGIRVPRLADLQFCPFRFVDNDYFRAMGYTLRMGRYFIPPGAGDSRELVVNRAFFGRYCPSGAQPCDVTVQLRMQPATMRVVGVVNDALERSPREGVGPVVYEYRTNSLRHTTVAVAARSDGDVRVLGKAMTRTIRAIDPTVPIDDLQPMQDRVNSVSAVSFFYALVLIAVAAICVLVSAVGAAGMVSYAVSRHRRSCAIQLALGASVPALVQFVCCDLCKWATGGVLVGLGVGALLNSVARGALFGVQPVELATYFGAAMAMAAVVVPCALVPALSVARIDPALSLRCE